MGCDIHSVIQGQWLHTSHDGKEIEKPDVSCWHTTQEGFHERDYELFGYLAGVRDPNIKPICGPRGLPRDFLIADDYHSLPINFNFGEDSFRRPDSKSPWQYYMGGHSHTWFTVGELKMAGELTLPNGEWEEYVKEVRRMAEIIRYQGILFPDYKNWRIVLGFDS